VITGPLPAATHAGASTSAFSSALKIARALLVGFALGLVVHVMLSLLLVQLGAQASGDTRDPRSAVQCRKHSVRPPAASRPSTTVTPS
jgi:hypothetical protein